MLPLLGTLAMLPSAGPQEAPRTLDLFLVARNEWRVEGLDWLNRTGTDGVEGILRTRVKALEAQKLPFMILEGGDCPLFPKQDEWKVFHTDRAFNEYDAMTETHVVRGVEKKKVLARGLSVATSSGGIHIQAPMKKPYYTSATFSYPFGHEKGDPAVCFQDVNSYRLTKTSPHAQDRERLDQTLLFCALPLAQAREYLEREKVGFEGVVITPAGLPQRDAPNFIAFPPSGVIAHYTLTRESNRWTARLVDYLTAPNDAGRKRLK